MPKHVSLMAFHSYVLDNSRLSSIVPHLPRREESCRTSYIGMLSSACWFASPFSTLLRLWLNSSWQSWAAVAKRPTFLPSIRASVDVGCAFAMILQSLQTVPSTSLYKTLDQSIIIYLWRQSTISALRCLYYLLKIHRFLVENCVLIMNWYSFEVLSTFRICFFILVFLLTFLVSFAMGSCHFAVKFCTPEHTNTVHTALRRCAMDNQQTTLFQSN